MAIRTSNLLRLTLAASAGISCLLADENLSFAKQFSPAAYADARAANPPVPGSVAGGAHRTRRAPAVGGAVVHAGVFYCASDVHYIPGGYWAPGPCYYGTLAPVPYIAPGYLPGPYPHSVTVTPVIGRWCGGWHWC